MRWLAVAVAACACGRLRFDPLAGDGRGPGDGRARDARAIDSGFIPRREVYLKASNTDAGDQLGSSLALSADGSTLAVSAAFEASSGSPADNSLPGAGAVYIYVRAGGTWVQQAYVKASNPGTTDRYGC